MENKKDYLIKYGNLKGKYVSQAFKEEEYEELIKLKKYLIKSFSENPKYANVILDGILVIDSYLLPEYTKLMNIFLKKISTKSQKEQKDIKSKLDINCLEENNIIYLKDLLKNIKN